MDDQPKNPNEPIKNRSLKIKLKSSKAMNGYCKEESQSSELKSCKGKLKDHLQSPSIDRENRKYTHPASDESFHAGNQKINSEKITCSVCGKIFPSDKSLYGHMRLHPERQWRGIKPPSSWSPKSISSLTVAVSTMGNIDDQQQSSPSTSERSDFDLLRSLKGWSKTGLRGWSGIELDSADGLLMLVNGKSLDLVRKNEVTNGVLEGTLTAAELKFRVQILKSSDLSKRLRNEKPEFRESEFQRKKHKVHQEYENYRNGFNPESVEIGPGWQFLNGFEEFSGNNSGVDPDGTYSLYSIARNSIPLESENQMKFSELGKMNYNETPMSSHSFICSICNKSFPSYQALGGHKSGHKNDNPNAGVGEWSLVDVKSLTTADDSQGFTRLRNAEIHQYKFCDKIFPTGQALGGHQRSHRTTLPEAPISTNSPPEVINMESPISIVSLSDMINKDSPISSVTLLEGASSMMGKKFLELDLNEPPPYEESSE